MAGGLHRKSEAHAKQIAWMALFMMKCASTVQTPHGQSINVSNLPSSFELFVMSVMQEGVYIGYTALEPTLGLQDFS